MFDSESRRSIIEHMNSDHADAVLAYVHAFAGLRDAAVARLVNIDEQGMDIEYQISKEKLMARVAYPKPLTSSSQVRGVLVSMVRDARTRLNT